MEIKLSTIKLYIGLALAFLLAAAVLCGIVLVAPKQNPPKGPIDIGVGPHPEAERNNTRVLIDIAAQTIQVEVTFRFNHLGKYFIYVLLPYTMESAAPFVIQNSVYYPLSVHYPDHPTNWIEVGDISENFENGYNSSILNATVELNPDFPFIFGGPDGKDELTIGATIKVKESLIAISDTLGTSQTVMFTFFGYNPEKGSDAFYPYTQPLSQSTIGYPFIVDITIPSSYYYADGQPVPIEYYVRQNVRLAKFSIDDEFWRRCSTILEAKYPELRETKTPTQQRSRLGR